VEPDRGCFPLATRRTKTGRRPAPRRAAALIRPPKRLSASVRSGAAGAGNHGFYGRPSTAHQAGRNVLSGAHGRPRPDVVLQNGRALSLPGAGRRRFPDVLPLDQHLAWLFGAPNSSIAGRAAGDNLPDFRPGSWIDREREGTTRGRADGDPRRFSKNLVTGTPGAVKGTTASIGQTRPTSSAGPGGRTWTLDGGWRNAGTDGPHALLLHRGGTTGGGRADRSSSMGVPRWFGRRFFCFPAGILRLSSSRGPPYVASRFGAGMEGGHQPRVVGPFEKVAAPARGAGANGGFRFLPHPAAEGPSGTSRSSESPWVCGVPLRGTAGRAVTEDSPRTFGAVVGRPERGRSGLGRRGRSPPGNRLRAPCGDLGPKQAQSDACSSAANLWPKFGKRLSGSLFSAPSAGQRESEAG